MIDFDDMVWIPAHFKIPIEQFDYVFVDESQDLNPCQQWIVMKACKSGRLIFVGDRYQAIYGFRGADVDSMSNIEQYLQSSEKGIKVLSLTNCFRCPKSHIRLAQNIVKDIEAGVDSKEGQISFNVELSKAIGSMREGDMVICRTNAPLVELAEVLKSRGKQVVVSGTEMENSLSSLYNKLRSKNFSDLVTRIESYREQTKIVIQKNGIGGEALIQLDDICDSLIVLCRQSKNPDEVQSKIHSLFKNVNRETDTKKSILLSSIHRAKGLERSRVYVLEPSLLPHPKSSESWQLQQEKNLAYVAVTRSSEHLIFIGKQSSFFKTT